jgi:hypothetical protein
MAKSEFNGHCDKCALDFTSVWKQSLLGFMKVECPLCRTEHTYPLSTGYRIIYWIILSLSIAGITATFSNGGVRAPGILGIAAAIALAHDFRLKRQFTSA